MLTLRSIKGCLFIVVFDFFISYSVFSSLYFSKHVKLWYSFLILVVLKINNFFSISGIQTFFQFLNASLYSILETTIAIMATSFIMRISFSAELIFAGFISEIFVLIFHFFILFENKNNKLKIILVGNNENTIAILEAIKKLKMNRFHILGIIEYLSESNSLFKEGIFKISFQNEKDIESIIQLNPDICVVCFKDWRNKINFYQLTQLKLFNIKCEDWVAFYGRIVKFIPIDNLRPSYLIFKTHFNDKLSLFLEDIFNRFMAFFGLIIFLPIMCIIAIFIKIEDRGPIFYLQERVGLNGKVFKIIKFRSMIKDAELLTGPKFAEENDERITRIGKILRKFGLDEIPQFINVLKGEMNIIGPRPERPIFVERMKKVIPYYELRHIIKPGITGWAQINYKYGDTIEDGKEKLKYDLYYIFFKLFLLDLIIIFSTLKRMILGRRRF